MCVSHCTSSESHTACLNCIRCYYFVSIRYRQCGRNARIRLCGRNCTAMSGDRVRAIERCHISKSPPEPRRVCALGEVPVDLIPDEPPHIQLLNALKQKHMCYRAVLCRHSRAFGSAGRQLVVGRQLCDPLWMLLQSNPLRSALIGQDCQRRRDQAQHRVQNESARRGGHAGRRGVMSRMSPRTWSRSTWAGGWLCGPAAACVLSAPFSIDDSASRLHSALGAARVNRPPPVRESSAEPQATPETLMCDPPRGGLHLLCLQVLVAHGTRTAPRALRGYDRTPCPQELRTRQLRRRLRRGRTASSEAPF